MAYTRVESPTHAIPIADPSQKRACMIALIVFTTKNLSSIGPSIRLVAIWYAPAFSRNAGMFPAVAPQENPQIVIGDCPVRLVR